MCVKSESMTLYFVELRTTGLTNPFPNPRALSLNKGVSVFSGLGRDRSSHVQGRRDSIQFSGSFGGQCYNKCKLSGAIKISSLLFSAWAKYRFT